MTMPKKKQESIEECADSHLCACEIAYSCDHISWGRWHKLKLIFCIDVPQRCLKQHAVTEYDVICQPSESVSPNQASQKQKIISYSITTAVRPILMPEMDFWFNFSYWMQFLNLKSLYLGGNGSFNLMAV